MKLSNKFTAVLFAGAMIMSNVGSSALAASYTVHKRTPNQIYLFPNNNYTDFESPQNKLYNTGNPVKKSGNPISVKVGESGSYRTMPVVTNVGQECQHTIEKINAQTYTNVRATFSNPNVIESLEPTVGTWTESGEYKDAGCLEYNFSAVGSGTTTVTLDYEISYYADGESVNCPTCGRTSTIPDMQGFYHYQDTFNVTVEEEAKTYTVTYTDGVTGKTIFPDETSEGLKAGERTPDFEGSTDRDGYTFMGWYPAKNTTVSADDANENGEIIYTATWQKKPENFTVTYTDGVADEGIFEDKTFTVSENDQTPSFGEAPVREGYTFAGWDPEVADRVTKDVTYTATWTKNDPVVDPEQPEDPKPGEKTNHPTIEKKIDGNVQSVNPGETINYTLTSNVPDYLGKYLPVKDKEDNVLRPAGEFKLVIHDDIDNGLTVNHDSVKVTIKNNDVPNQYYTIEQNVECKDEKICDFHISMDLVKLYEAGIIDLEDIRNAEKIVVTYSATVSEEIKPGSYHNTAWVTYTGDGTSEPDDPDVDVYGIYLKKVDQDNPDKVLAGAEFELYAADKITKLGSAVSGENGIAKFDVSLKAGTYYVKETKSPEGYVASSDFIKIEITENDLTVETDEKSELYFYKGTEVPNVSVPETGGTGTDTLYMTGAGVIAAAGLIYFISRRRRTEQSV